MIYIVNRLNRYMTNTVDISIDVLGVFIDEEMAYKRLEVEKIKIAEEFKGDYDILNETQSNIEFMKEEDVIEVQVIRTEINKFIK